MNGLFRCPGALTDHKNGDLRAADGPVLGSEEAPTQSTRPIIDFSLFLALRSTGLPSIYLTKQQTNFFFKNLGQCPPAGAYPPNYERHKRYLKSVLCA